MKCAYPMPGPRLIRNSSMSDSASTVVAFLWKIREVTRISCMSGFLCSWIAADDQTLPLPLLTDGATGPLAGTLAVTAITDGAMEKLGMGRFLGGLTGAGRTLRLACVAYRRPVDRRTQPFASHSGQFLDLRRILRGHLPLRLFPLVHSASTDAQGPRKRCLRPKKMGRLFKSVCDFAVIHDAQSMFSIPDSQE